MPSRAAPLRFSFLVFAALLVGQTLSTQAAQRPKPGEALRTPLVQVAAQGQFDPGRVRILGRQGTRRGYEALFISIPSKDPTRGSP